MKALDGKSTLLGAVVVFAAIALMGASGVSYFEGKSVKTSTLQVGSTSTFGDSVTFAKEINFTNAAVSLTSPTVTFSAADRNLVILASDANQTGYYPTGGTLNQLLIIRTGAGSNTLRFDDGTSMTLGGNITLTEGQGDVLILQCVSADGDEWVCLSDRSGN